MDSKSFKSVHLESSETDDDYGIPLSIQASFPKTRPKQIIERQHGKSEWKRTLPSLRKMLFHSGEKSTDSNFESPYPLSVVEMGITKHLSEILPCTPREFTDATDMMMNPPLTPSTREWKKKFMSKETNLHLRNAEGETPLQMTNKPNAADILNEYFSKLPEFYATSLRRINVPEENNCLLWSVTLAYLYPLRYDDYAFMVRCTSLFGYGKPKKTFEEVQRLIQDYNPISREVNIHKESLVSSLVTNQFRNRVANTSSFLPEATVTELLRLKPENYYTHGTLQRTFCMLFRTEIEKYNIDVSKLQPDLLNENTLHAIVNELNKVPDQKEVKRFLIGTPKHYSQNSDSPFGYSEIEAISLMLYCNIIVFSREDNKAVTHFGGDNQIYLFYKGGDRYDFGLVRVEELIKAVINGERRLIQGFLSVGVDDINHKHTGGWTVLHFAAAQDYSEIFKLLVDAGGKTTVRDLLNQTPSDVARAFRKGMCHVTKTSPKTQSFGHVSFDSKLKSVPFPQYGQWTPLIAYPVDYEDSFRENNPCTELLMFVFLQGLQKERNGNISEFCLHAVEHETCVNIIFRFKYKTQNETEKSKIICIQASLRTSDEETVSVDKLLSDSFRDETAFTLQRYIKFYRLIRYQLLHGNRDNPLFGSTLGDLDCDFVMYTDAPSTFEEDDNKSTIKVATDPEDIFCWERENTYYWKLNPDEAKYQKATDILKNSSVCLQLAKELLRCVFHPDKGNDSKRIYILEEYRHFLNDEVIIKVAGNVGDWVFRESFLDLDENFDDADKENRVFREALFEEAEKFFQKSRYQLKQYLRGKTFRVPFEFNKSSRQKRQYFPPDRFFSDSELKVLLTNLKFFVCQPDQKQLNEIIKQKIRNMYSLDKSDTEAVFSSVKGTFEELRRRGRMLITQRDRIFENCVKVALFSKVKILDRVHKLVNNDSSDCLEGSDKDGLVLFHFAVGVGHLDIVKFLVREGININQRYFSQETALYNAVRNNHYSIVSFFVKNKAQVNVVNERGESPLHLAVSLGRTEIVKLLTNEDININVADEEGNTPLHYAAKQGNLAIAKILLEKGSNVDAFDNNGKTALQVAIEALEENFGIVSYLVEQNATLTSVDNDGWTLLQSAAYSNKPNVIELLLRKGTDINTRNDQGQTPFHLASMASSKEAIKSLLKKGANIHAVDCDGRTFLEAANEETKESITSLKEYNAIKLNPWSENTKLVSLLECSESAEQVRSLLEEQTIDMNAVSNKDGETVLFPAVRKGDEELVKLFLDKGADTYISNHIQETVLHAASRTGNKKVVQLLLCRDVDVNRRNCCGETALHEAARVGDKEIVRILFEKDPEAINNKTALGDTALHNAAINGHLEVVEFLIANRAEMDYRNYGGETPLHSASAAGGKDVVKSLMKHGANIQARNYEGNTPLHVAAQKGKQEVVQILLEEGVQINARNFNRETPLHLASNKEVVRLLINGGADINAKTSQTPLHFYARNGKISNIRELLINVERKGVSVKEYVSAQDDAGTQPIHLAAREGHKDVVALLLQNGASVDAEDHSGLRPMHFAANEGHMDVIRLLLEKRGVIVAQDKCGMQPIHLAAREGHRDVVEFFLEKKKSLKDIKSAAEVTPLHLASRNLHVTTISLLLNKNADTTVEDKLEQNFLHHFSSGLYTGHKELVSRAVGFITMVGARLLKDQVSAEQIYQSSAEQIYLERVSASNHKQGLTFQVAKTKLSTICGFKIISDFYLALKRLVADATQKCFKGNSSDIDDNQSEILNQIKKIKHYQNSAPCLEVVLFFPKCLLHALDVSLSTFLAKSGTVSENHVAAKERLLTDFAKLLAEYNDYVDDIIYTKKEALENLNISEKLTCFINGMRELSNKLHEDVHDNAGCNFPNSAFLSDILADYIKLTDPKCSKGQGDSAKPLEKLCIQRALQVAGDEQTIEMLKEHLDDETSAALKDLRHNYLSHLDERSNCFARVMTEYNVDAFSVAEDLDHIIKDLATGLKRKIKLQKVETLCEHLKWLSKKDKELQDIAENLRTFDKQVQNKQKSIVNNLDEVGVLMDGIKELKGSVQQAICGKEQTGEFERLVLSELNRYCSYVLKDNSSEWKLYLCIPFFYRRLQLLRNEVLKDSLIGENLRKTFTYTVNQKPVEKTVTFLKKYKKSLAGTEFLIFELRNILTDAFRNSKGEFDKKLREKINSMVGNRSLRNYLAHIAHGSKLCHALTDLARVVAYDAHMFMDKGKAVTAFQELSFRIKKDGKKWNEDNKSKVLFTEIIDCNYRVELLNALKDITGDVTMLGDEIEKFLGNLNDSEFKSMIKKCEERVELLKIFRDATASSQKEKLKTKFKGYLKDLSVEEFTEILVAFSKQNVFLEIVEKITGPKSLAKELKKYLSNSKLIFKEIKKSENFENLLIVLRHIAQNHQELSEVLESQLMSYVTENYSASCLQNSMPCNMNGRCG